MLKSAHKPLAELENSAEFQARHIGPVATDEALMLSVIGPASRRAPIESIVPRPIARAKAMQLPAELTEAQALAELGIPSDTSLANFILARFASAEEAEALVEEEEAQGALAEGDTDTALEKLQHAVATDPANDDARFDYIKLLLQLGRDDDAKVAFAPVIAKAATVRKFDALQRWMHAIDFAATHADAAGAQAAFDAQIAANKRDFDARFGRARLLIAAQRWTDAMDELLDILMRDKTWKEDLARKTYIAILDIMETPKPKVADGQIPPEDAVVATYRRRLSSVVLS